ncbi:NlpC/P60 family protein [Kutzneria albida]|uniref:NLP/P60-family protein n=1 Tax=Kutzneria albida DSM 43870 TaxID=1449976 RepID=W5W6S3_9PSEU|nr:C40 family peptidase [Kutzneria albida]AHH96597.1 NLP/P60-family protein [Kutzneria albida DSM 43870]
MNKANRFWVAGAVGVLFGLTAAPALADPPANEDPVAKLKAAGQQAEELHEKYVLAQHDLEARQAEVERAKADVGKAQRAGQAARTEQERFRGQVDQFAAASFSGTQFTSMSALLSGQSAQDFLDRSWLLDEVSRQNGQVLDGMNSAVDKANSADQQAQQAQQRASEAAAQAQRVKDDLGRREAEATRAKNEAQTALDQLSSSQRTTLRGDRGVSYGPINAPGAAGAAVRAALSQVGTPYNLGAESPGVAFDCSGLVQWAYRQAGVSITRITTTQYAEGAPVSRGDLRPGDLVFFGTAADIHHVGMFIGEGKVVHAPDFGQVVKVVPLEQAGRDYYGARRIVA